VPSVKFTSSGDRYGKVAISMRGLHYTRHRRTSARGLRWTSFPQSGYKHGLPAVQHTSILAASGQCDSNRTIRTCHQTTTVELRLPSADTPRSQVLVGIVRCHATMTAVSDCAQSAARAATGTRATVVPCRPYPSAIADCVQRNSRPSQSDQSVRTQSYIPARVMATST